MITSKHMDESWVAQFVGEEESDGLHVILVSVDIISLKQVLLVRRWPYLIEETDEVLQLPVNITCYDHWGFHLYYDWFFLQLGYNQI